DAPRGDPAQLEPRLLRLASEGARFRNRREIAVALRSGLWFRHELRAFRKDAFDLGVWPRDHVNRYELADATRGGGAGVRRGLYRANVAAHHHGHVTGADVFLADERHVRGL